VVVDGLSGGDSIEGHGTEAEWGGLGDVSQAGFVTFGLFDRWRVEWE
jgi:hypothetical protein